MFMIVFIIFGTLIFAREISGYDIKYNNRKYFVLQNKVISKILLSKSVGTQRRSRLRCKTDFNKMTYVGAVFYLCNLLLVLSISISLFLLPEIKTQPYELDTRYIYIWVDTINEELPVLLSLILLAVEIIFEFRKILTSCSIAALSPTCYAYATIGTNLPIFNKDTDNKLLFVSFPFSYLYYSMIFLSLTTFSESEASLKNTLDVPATKIFAPASLISLAFSKLTFPSTSISICS